MFEGHRTLDEMSERVAVALAKHARNFAILHTRPCADCVHRSSDAQEGSAGAGAAHRAYNPFDGRGCDRDAQLAREAGGDQRADVASEQLSVRCSARSSLRASCSPLGERSAGGDHRVVDCWSEAKWPNFMDAVEGVLERACHARAPPMAWRGVGDPRHGELVRIGREGGGQVRCRGEGVSDETRDHGAEDAWDLHGAELVEAHHDARRLRGPGEVQDARR